jgi:hypothetical protein
MMIETDYPEWSNDRLVRRLQEVTETSKMRHTHRRQAELDRELAHLLFELRSRGIPQRYLDAASAN